MDGAPPKSSSSIYSYPTSPAQAPLPFCEKQSINLFRTNKLEESTTSLKIYLYTSKFQKLGGSFTLLEAKEMAVVAEKEMGFEATELRLGLPGGRADGGEAAKNSLGKRGFSETIDLKLKLETLDSKAAAAGVGGGGGGEGIMKRSPTQKTLLPSAPSAADPAKPPAPKAQVVGWPPVRSFRKNIMSIQSEKGNKESSTAAAFIKVSMDGAPYLRKVDLKIYRSYQELYMALEKMFSSFTIGNCGSQGMNGRDFMNESKLMDLLNGSEYVPTYEDKDGDWMLVGDVPWEMFVESCKRLRIMKGSEAIGLAPRAMEKCKSRS